MTCRAHRTMHRTARNRSYISRIKKAVRFVNSHGFLVDSGVFRTNHPIRNDKVNSNSPSPVKLIRAVPMFSATKAKQIAAPSNKSK